MINFKKFILDNGLRVIVHEDHSTPMAMVNVLYDVGAKDEDPEQTGFAHLFEHLMFGGSLHIPSYDEPLQIAGGQNNAFTTDDLTNYYCQVPAKNLETAFWLESDRMLSLAFSEESLEVQRKVVCEEFKEHYINKPYGNAWHLIRELSFQIHPYRWMTIGKELSHIEKARMEDVKSFFKKHYNPMNAILAIGGHVTFDQVETLAKKWFGNIPPGEKYIRHLPEEPEQKEARKKEVYEEVPLNALYKTWHIPGRMDQGYYAIDLISEILSGGNSSRLYESLVKKKKLFSSISCYHFGNVEPGLISIEGKLVPGVKMQDAENAVEEELDLLKSHLLEDQELQKVKNKTESITVFEDMSIMSRATNLSFYELMGNANLMNKELEKYQSINIDHILESAQKTFKEENSNTLYYFKK
ncbi:MAG: insulinase family protein [Bacteroidetes bacterium]|nr:insulinase family protein [Bacteroidota bacterium]